ncbi:porin [Alloalcanivorax dieselolei]|uniref:porin n=1 Tax=Alloalcanivorax dieselolei TaxID=285091 RepID=UPI0002E48324|nr:porin [Alloalcanivorax dieselolei]
MIRKFAIATVLGASLACPPLKAEGLSIYGAINLTLEHVGATPDIKDQFKISDSYSWVALRSDHKINDDLSVYAVAQTMFDSSGSTEPSSINNGFCEDQCHIGLKSRRYGALRAGYFQVHNPTGILKWDGAAVYMGMSTLMLPLVYGNGQTFSSSAGGRVRNVVEYSTPTWKGLNTSYFFARPNEELTTSGNAGRLYGGTLTYTHGNWFTLYSHLRTEDSSSISAVDDFRIRGNRFVLSYSPKQGLNAAIVVDRQTTDDPNYANGMTRTTFGIPVWYRNGKHVFAGTYAKASGVSGIDDSGAQFSMVGYSYFLTRSTNLYISYSKIYNEENAKYDFQTHAQVGGLQGPPSFISNLPTGADPRAFQIGIRHSFLL